MPERLNEDIAGGLEGLQALPRIGFTISGGEVTPTMKVKRRVVEERWRAVIEKLYEQEGPPVGVAT